MANKQAEILNAHGLMVYKNGEYDKALKDFNEALELDKGYAACFTNRGNVFLKKNEFQKALDDFNAALEITPNDSDALAGRGQAYVNLKEFDKAIESYNLAIKIKPFNGEYKNLLGSAFIKKGESEINSGPVVVSPPKSLYLRYKNKLSEFTFEGETKETIDFNLEQLGRLENSGDSSNIASFQNWFEWVIKLPWKETPQEENYSLSDAEKILEESHFGLNDVKARIIEYLAVRKKKKDSRGAILCLSGPPGVGKTSVGKSIAQAMGKEFFRFSVGGAHDEAAIRGHRRAYIGSQPGQIIKGLATRKTKSLVCLIDEVDKMNSNGFNGDPYAALLEVLDPEQNNTFRDNYIDMPFDLSNIFFILTANYPQLIPAAVLDRVEFINIPGYIAVEKLTIAKNYLVPKTLERNGLEKEQVSYSDEALLHIANGYSLSPGVRDMEKNLDEIHRKIVRKIVSAEEKKSQNAELNYSVIAKKDVEAYLGKPKFNYDKDSADLQKADNPGMAIGLAVAGGFLGGALTIEVISVRGEEGFTVTGNMQKVMKESVKIAYTITRKLAIEKYGVLDSDWFQTNHLHIHVPEGAIPKDGPSAGITMAAAMLSLYRNKIVCPNFAMTGELTLNGRVLRIGGLKEKLIGAKQNRAEHIIFPRQNLSDLDEIPEVVKDGITFHPVDRLEEVLALVLPD